MWRIAPLIRPGAWFCLLGSVLALVAFFLPFYNSLPGSSLPSASLGDCLTSCVLLDRLFQESNTGFGVVALSAWALFLLLLSIMVLAVLALFLRSSRWNIAAIYLRLTILTLVGYLLVALWTLFYTWVGIYIASTAAENPDQETLSLIGIGSLLIPVGLLLAFWGGVLLRRSPTERQGHERRAEGLRRRWFPRTPRWLYEILVVLALLLVVTLISIYLPLGEVQRSVPDDVSLSSLSMVSATEGWVVGQRVDQRGTRNGLIYHYQDGVWKRDTLPSGSGSFTRVWMLSSQEGWAVGFLDLQDRSEGQIYHYQDGVWEQYMLVPETNALFGIQLLSPDEGWAVGAQGIILHYQQGSWTPVLSPTSQDLFGIFMLSPQEGWAVGFDTILHFHNGLWQEVADPFPRDALESISMVSPIQGWIVGLRGATLQYIDGQWEQVPSDTSAASYGALWGVAMVSASEGWAVGNGAIFHYLGGAWKTAVSLSNVSLSAIEMVSAQEGWAVGSTEAPGQSGIIMHYSQGTWVQVKVPDLEPIG